MRLSGERRFTSLAASTSPRAPVIEIAARHLIEPLPQGTLDRLCGIYAALNGIRLALHKHGVGQRAHKALFRAGVDFLEHRGMLQHAVNFGMSRNRWHGLAQHIAHHAETDEFAIDLEKPAWDGPPDIGQVIAWIEASLSDGKPLLARIKSKGIDHFSVCAGIDQGKIHLFDSAGLKFVRRSGSGLASATLSIRPKALLRIAVRPR